MTSMDPFPGHIDPDVFTSAWSRILTVSLLDHYTVRLNKSLHSVSPDRYFEKFSGNFHT